MANEIVVDDMILLYAFRHVLGSGEEAVLDVAEELTKNQSRISITTRQQIRREIEDADGRVEQMERFIWKRVYASLDPAPPF